jgi:ABC-type glutathione transport system ATPase component
VPPEPFLVVEELRKHYAVKGRGWKGGSTIVRAVDGVSFSVAAGDTLGIIGESGSGKSTTGLAIARLIEPTGGSIRINGVDAVNASRSQARQVRSWVQIVFQNPYASLDPRRSVGASIAEPLLTQRRGSRHQRRARVAELLGLVGLNAAYARRYPQELSGGEQQRVGIARAIAVTPRLIVCDEAVSALDVSIQAQILNLLRDLQAQLGLSYVFISHDIGAVRAMSDRLVVMNGGRVVESGPSDQICDAPADPYTRKLLASARGGEA